MLLEVHVSTLNPGDREPGEKQKHVGSESGHKRQRWQEVMEEQNKKNVKAVTVSH